MLLAAEAVAAPVLLGTVFLGTLVIGLKASGPVEQARRRQLEFTADASHELRTPLSVIEAETGLALSTPRDAGQYQTALRRVSRESRRLRSIVDNLLWLARFDSEPANPANEPVDVLTIAEICADRFSAIARSRGIDLSVRCEGEPQAWINAPPEWVDRLTGVLVDNACRHAAAAGRPAPAVRIVVASAGNRVSLTVEDSGPGIPDDERARLFDRFYRAGACRRQRVRSRTGHRRRRGPLDRGQVARRRQPAGRRQHAGDLEPRYPPLRSPAALAGYRLTGGIDDRPACGTDPCHGAARPSTNSPGNSPTTRLAAIAGCRRPAPVTLRRVRCIQSRGATRAVPGGRSTRFASCPSAVTAGSGPYGNVKRPEVGWRAPSGKRTRMPRFSVSSCLYRTHACGS